MTARTMARLRREPTPHTDWCARDHRCGVVEHRSPPIVAATPHGRGRAVMTRVRAADADYAEVHIRIPLHRNDHTARGQLGTALRLLRELLTAVAAQPAALTGHTRPALDRRTTA